MKAGLMETQLTTKSKVESYISLVAFILISASAFIGDVILATPIVEKLRRFYPDAQIDFLLRRGNEKLLANHPHIRQVWVWDKKKDKYPGLWNLVGAIRKERYDWAFNCQRFAASGVVRWRPCPRGS